jgi:thiamine biosynthesis lipoprotein
MMVQAARNAMATRFEIVLHGADPVALRAAAEEALDEVERLDSKLSLYRPDSEVAHLNARAARESVRVSPELFRLLEHIKQLHEETTGAFDITVGPLMRVWGFMGGSRQLPDAGQLEEARQCVGMHLVQLDRDSLSVRFAQPGVILDLGAVGKGYAIEKAAELLREAGVSSALIHGGTSTSYAIGKPPNEDAWKIAIELPTPGVQGVPLSSSGGEEAAVSKTTDEPRTRAVVSLVDSALSVSAVWGKSFTSGEITYGHIIDPRTGAPASKAVLAAVSLSSAMESDALSTALLTLGIAGHEAISRLHSDIRTLVVEQSGQSTFTIASFGIEQ